MNKRMSIFFILSIFLLSFVSSFELNLTTQPGLDVWVSSYDPDEPRMSVSPPSKYYSYKENIMIYYEVDGPFLLAIKLKNGTKEVLFEQFNETYFPNESAQISFYPDTYVPEKDNPELFVQNTDENESDNSTVQVNESNLELTQLNESNSSSALDNKRKLDWLDYNSYSVIIVLILFAFALVLTFIPKSPKMKIELINKRISRMESRIKRLKRKKKKLFLDIKKDLIKNEENLIKMRGGSVPKKEKEESLVKKLKSEIKKNRD